MAPRLQKPEHPAHPLPVRCCTTFLWMEAPDCGATLAMLPVHQLALPTKSVEYIESIPIDPIHYALIEMIRIDPIHYALIDIVRIDSMGLVDMAQCTD